MKDSAAGDGAVAEMQGLYGPFTFPEKLLQQIWQRGEFDAARAATTDGRPLKILHPGRWNHLGGPDFKDARLELGGVSLIGDVEVHLRAADWVAHRHAADPAYDHVVLHVILFPSQELFTIGSGGAAIPVLALLPLLHHALEEYAADEAVERLAGQSPTHFTRELALMPLEKLTEALLRRAEMRWRQKVHYARTRIDRLGWEAACHHTALEILGYRFNRAPLLAVAGRWPLENWGKRGGEVAELAWTAYADRWSRQGVRPANHPHERLRQYAQWVAVRPDWPQRWAEWAGRLPVVGLAEAVQTAQVRRRHGWTALTARIAETVLGDEIGGTRFNTMMCDGLLPLLAAQVGGEANLSGVWHAWPVGDVPLKHTRLLRELGVVDRRARPLCHGVVQGLISWLLVADERREPSGTTMEGGGA